MKPFFAFLLGVLASSVLGVSSYQAPLVTLRANNAFAGEIHAQWVERGGYDGMLEWDADWVTHYQGMDDLLSGRPVGEVPDIHRKWNEGEYR